MTIHPYLYVYADPVNLLDPDGLGPCSFGSPDCLLYDGGLPENKDAPPLDERNTFTTHTTCMTKCMARRLLIGELESGVVEAAAQKAARQMPTQKLRAIGNAFCRVLSFAQAVDFLYQNMFRNPGLCARECLDR